MKSGLTGRNTILEMLTRLKERMRGNKRGSLLVEGTVILPPFIIGMILLISIIPSIAAAESAVFSACDELIKANARSAIVREPVSAPLAIRRRVKSENPGLSKVIIKGYGYGYAQGNMEDLISVDMLLRTGGLNPLGRISKVDIEIKIRSRALTGTRREEDGNQEQFTLDENYIRVYVFPRSGEKYHNRNCYFLNPDCHMTYLTEGVRSSYSPCPNCKSERASIGTPVFCFSGSRTDYHLGSCPAVTKYYIEMERGEALEKGYSPCNSCGG